MLEQYGEPDLFINVVRSMPLIKSAGDNSTVQDGNCCGRIHTDCIACHQAGVTNVVATLGTALTEEHVRVLKRFVERVVLIYDGDEAGQRAAERSISQFLAQDLDLRILTLPDGVDPADFLEQQSADEFRSLIEGADEAWEYKLQSILKRTGTDTINGRQQTLNQMLEFLIASPGVQGTVREA